MDHRSDSAEQIIYFTESSFEKICFAVCTLHRYYKLVNVKWNFTQKFLVAISMPFFLRIGLMCFRGDCKHRVLLERWHDRADANWHP